MSPNTCGTYAADFLALGTVCKDGVLIVDGFDDLTTKVPINHYWSIRHYRGWQFIPLVLFVLVLVLSETVLAVEGKHRDFVEKRAEYWGFSVPEKVIDLNRFRRFRVRVPRH